MKARDLLDLFEVYGIGLAYIGSLETMLDGLEANGRGAPKLRTLVAHLRDGITQEQDTVRDQLAALMTEAEIENAKLEATNRRQHGRREH